MSKQDMLKVQTCVLRVNIHCEGCMHKVKKKLQKVEGVYKVSIDAEQGKVMVSGNADPASLIAKLEKAGKQAELWGPPQKGGAAMPFPISADQLKKFQMESFNKNNQKKGNHEPQLMMKNGFVQLPSKKGGAKEEKFPAKDHKSVRFDLSEHEDDDDYDDEDDDFDDEFDEEDEDDFEDEFGERDVHSKPLVKGAVVGGGGQKASKAVGNPHKGDKGGGKDGKEKKSKKGGGGGIDMFIKGMLKKAGGKKGKSDKSSKKGENKKEEGGGKKGGGKKVGFELGDGKKWKNDDGWSKKAGENFHGGKHQQHNQQQAFNEMKANHKGGGGGGGGRNMEMMGQMGGFPAVAGMPAMNGGGRFAGAGPGNPYSQQQYMAQMQQMMMMNQQRENGHGHGHDAAYHPMAYARAPPAMSYGPPPPHMGYGGPQPMGYGAPAASGEYAHMFSDENTDSCGIM